MLACEKTAKEAVRQAIELQAVFLLDSSKKRVPGQSGRAQHPHPGDQAKDDQHVGAARSQATYGVTAPTGRRQKTTTSARNEEKDLRQTHGNRVED